MLDQTANPKSGNGTDRALTRIRGIPGTAAVVRTEHAVQRCFGWRGGRRRNAGLFFGGLARAAKKDKRQYDECNNADGKDHEKYDDRGAITHAVGRRKPSSRKNK